MEAKTVTHENIRGGTYFDRGEVETVKSADEIEAEYLEEERLGIKNDQSVSPRCREPRKARVSANRAELASEVERAPRRGGEEPQLGYEVGSSCASPSGCVAEDSREGERMRDVRMCASDETWGQSPNLEPKEVS